MTVKRRILTRPQITATVWTAILIGPGSLLAPSLAQPEAVPTRIEIKPTTSDEPKLVREGAFLSSMHGELRQSKLGWVMDFAPDAKTGKRLVSMILQRGMTLTAMEQIIEAHDGSIGFVVSGQVFVYHNRNYLLPTRFAITNETDSPSPDTGSATDPTSPSSDQGLPGIDDESDEPTIEGLFEGVQSGPTDNADMPMAPAVSRAARHREGEMIAQVRGRILPGVGGELVFTPDTDAESDTAGDEVSPMGLMPSLNVERLEKLRSEWGDRLIVSMSGRIFVDAGRPMLLPTMYVIELERTGNLSLGQ